MVYLLGGAIVVWLVLTGAKNFARANPVVLARLLKRFGGVLSLGLAAGLLVFGRIGGALALGTFGFWLLGWSATPGWFASVGGKRRAKQSSRVRSAMIEMELDHESGAMQGRIVSGPQQGRPLDDLTRPECEALYRLCLSDDPEGARLLEAYLDRRFAGWRVAGDADRDTGGSSADARTGPMSEDHAYEVLGLQKGASREEIVKAHRALMKEFHPDHGGSTDRAARVNEAKDVLMRRHV